MLKTLIVDDNLQYVKMFLNTTINKFKEIHVTHIATTVKEALDIISTNYIDLIFLDLKLPDSNGIEIINKINFLNNIKTPYIIVISGDIALSSEINRKCNILDIINKLENNNVLYNKIERIIHTATILNNKENIKKEISKELAEIGYNWKYKGTNYILEAILYIYESNNMDLLDNLEKMYINIYLIKIIKI